MWGPASPGAALSTQRLQHTFGARAAARGVPMRSLQEWTGHLDSKTTQLYAHYQPSGHESDPIDQMFEQDADRFHRTIHRTI